MRGPNCRGCKRPVRQPHAYGCTVPKKLDRNIEAEPPELLEEERPRRRSAFSIASLSILGEL